MNSIEQASFINNEHNVDLNSQFEEKVNPSGDMSNINHEGQMEENFQFEDQKIDQTANMDSNFLEKKLNPNDLPTNTDNNEDTKISLPVSEDEEVIPRRKKRKAVKRKPKNYFDE